MLLIDGVRYLETPPKDEDELEQMVVEHAQEIFGENSIYLDLKHKVKSKSGIGSIPDGYVIILGNTPQWHIIEVELSSHPLHDHIVSQIGRFVGGIKNPNTQAEIVSAIYDEISEDTILIARMRQIIGSNEIYKYLTDCISTTPIVTIIIEKATPELDDALEAINHPIKKVIEFRTLVRENAETVHAHLFEPITIKASIMPKPPKPEPVAKFSSRDHKESIAGKVTFQELINVGLIKEEQVLYFYNTELFKDEQAQVIVTKNKLKYVKDNKTYSKSELAKQLLIKHNFKHDNHGVAGPRYWQTEDGNSLADLEEKVRIQRGDRK